MLLTLLAGISIYFKQIAACNGFTGKVINLHFGYVNTVLVDFNLVAQLVCTLVVAIVNHIHQPAIRHIIHL